MSTQRVGIIGGGILGLAVGRRIGELFAGAEVTVMEKEDRLALHQTGHNSGVVHAGLYYAPGSLKATLCRRGVDLLKEYTQERGLPYDECGKLVIAVDDSERGALENIWKRASENGVPGITRLEGSQLQEIEPHAAGVAAIHSPFTAITDYVAISEAYGDDIVKAGGTIELNFPVESIAQSATGVRVTSGARSLSFDRLVICAGLQSDTVATLAGDDAGPAIVPFRGEYFTLTPEATRLCRGMIYPVPDPNYPFLGVHFTKRVNGTVDVGPNAVLAFAREGYRRSQVSPRELAAALAWPGFRKLAVKHWKMGLGEMAGSVSKRLYLKRAQAYVPAVRAQDMVAAPAGVRAQALDRDGSLVDDFRISTLDRILAVRNAPSPAATSSLAIAEYITEHLREHLGSRTA